MGKARVNGNHVQLLIFNQQNLAPLFLGELDNFQATSQTSIIKSRPIGFIQEGVTHNYGGWDLSFDGGKVDWALCHYYWLQDQKLRKRRVPPQLMIIESVEHYNGALEQYVYKNVSLYGLDLQRPAGDTLTETMKGFAANRTLGPIDTTIIYDPIGTAIRELSMRVQNERVTKDYLQAWERPF